MRSTKIISLILLISFSSLAFFTPLQTVQAAFDWWYWVDNFIIRPLLRKIVNAIENRLLNRVGEIVSDKVNGGRDPYWITNWRNHLLDSEARGVDVFRAVLADTELCPHFNDDLKRAFGAENFIGLVDGSGNLTFAPGNDPFQVSSRCTFDYDADAFAEDFTQGGWDAWNQLILPQNNFYGAMTQALAERDYQLNIESQASQDQSIGQDGWKGAKYDAYLGGTRASGCVKKPDGLPRCPFLGKMVTPGTLFDQATRKRLDQKFETIGGANEIMDVILALADAVVTKISNQLGNLLGLDITGAPVDGGFFTERGYQAELDAAVGTQGSAQSQGAGTLACTQQCRTQTYLQCEILPVDQRQQCINSAIGGCILNCQ